jgi:hypothetical protein
MIWDINAFATSIEILYVIPLGIMIAVLIATLYGKLTIPIGIIGIALGIVMAWLLAPYTSLVMSPLANTLWYGYAWTLLEVFAVIHIFSVFWMAGIGVYNLYRSGGITAWT